jgi:hypothetical protein
MRVAPRSTQDGSTTVSAPISTVASIAAVAGSTSVTPARMWASLMRCWAMARTRARSTRSLIPSVTVQSVATWAAISRPASRIRGSTSGR